MNNRKRSFYRYLIITSISAIIGGVGGYIAILSRYLNWNFGWILKLLPTIICTLLLSTLLIILVLTILKYFKAKKLVNLSNDEDEEIYLLADKELSMVSSLNAVGSVLGMVMMGLVIPMMSYWERNDSSLIGIYSIVLGMSTVISFIIYIIVSTCLQVKTVDLIKKIYPEKKGYALEKKFETVWLESADENEKRIIGEASYYSYRLTQKVLSYVMVVALFIGMFQPDSYVFVILIGIGWLTQTISYLKKVRDLEFKKK